MSIPLIITRGIGNGSLAGSTAGIISRGFLGTSEQSITVSVSTDPLAALLLASSGISSQIKIQAIDQMSFINMDADKCPWIGIYRTEYIDEPSPLSKVTYWDRREKIQVIAQATSYKSGSDCEVRLDNLVNEIVQAIKADTTILNSVESVNSININYEYDYSDRESLHFQGAIVEIETTVSKSYA